MEKVDEAAYKVLKSNYAVLSADLDARRVATEAARVGLITAEEKRAIWHCAGRDGVSAGVERLLDFLLLKSRTGVFQQFVETLQSHSDLKFWADCLKDEYEAEKRKERVQAEPAGVEGTVQAYQVEEGTKPKRPGLRKSLITVDVETPPNVRKKLSEATLLKDFQRAKGHDRDVVLGILSRYEERDLQSILDPATNKSLLHIACEIMDFIVVKLLVEKYELNINAKDSLGNTPLHIACLSQKVQTVIFLVKVPSCDPNIRNFDGLTPLHIVAQSGPGIIITHLLTMTTLDRSITDEEGRDAISIIRSNPKLAASLDRKVSTVSLGSISSRQSSEDIRRKVSAQSNLDSYRWTEETRSLLSVSPEAENEELLEREQSSPTQSSHVVHFEETANGKHFEEASNGVELRELGTGNGNDEVVFRDKSKSAPEKDEDVEQAISCYSCCHPGKKQKYQMQVEKQKRPFQFERFCGLSIGMCYLLLGIFVGLLLLGALAYLLISENS